MITVGMMADAGDESVQHLRFFDTESYDTGNIGRVCEEYNHCVDHLVAKGNCRQLGYTFCMLQHLAKVRTFVLPGGQVKIFGAEHSVSDAAFNHSLSMMQNFVVLSLEVMLAEFPHWDLLRSFEAFDLARHVAGGKRDDWTG